MPDRGARKYTIYSIRVGGNRLLLGQVRLQHVKRAGEAFGRVRGGRAALIHRVAIAFRKQALEEEHGEPVVIGPPLADLFAAIEDGPRDAVDGAAERRVGKAGGALGERMIPRLPERARVGTVAQGIGGARRLADGAA
ncbi:hypothetical protein [Sphingomonas sp.]|uniref:hypothetical protein n=1 Tax=Sphingomonas sp. TaxID=28214 RepID=UPI002D803711|nr:hypothetical protein [Sphingomonas sp.]HEU0044173.1 hypothetical protein [Sphingomonas sp.]